MMEDKTISSYPRDLKWFVGQLNEFLHGSLKTCQLQAKGCQSRNISCGEYEAALWRARISEVEIIINHVKFLMLGLEERELSPGDV